MRVVSHIVCNVVIAAAVVWVCTPALCFAQQEGEAAHAQEVARDAAEHAIEQEHGGGGGPNPLAWDPDLAIWTLVVFLLLFGILGKFAWPQISQALEERERQIADNIAAAAAKNEEAKRLLAEYEAKLAAAAGEVRALLEEARRDAEHTKGQIVEEARKAAGDEVKRAEREIERAKNSAIDALARRSTDVAIDLARRVVRDDLRPDRQDQLVREALSILASQTSKN